MYIGHCLEVPQLTGFLLRLIATGLTFFVFHGMRIICQGVLLSLNISLAPVQCSQLVCMLQHRHTHC